MNTIVIQDVTTILVSTSITVLALTLSAAAIVILITRNRHDLSRPGQRPAASSAGAVRPPTPTNDHVPRYILRRLVITLWPYTTRRSSDRVTALLLHSVQLDPFAVNFVRYSICRGELHIVASTSHSRETSAAYRDKELRERELNPTLRNCPTIFLEIDATPGANPTSCIKVRGVDIDARLPRPAYRPRRRSGLLGCGQPAHQQHNGARTHLYFTWPDGRSFRRLPADAAVSRTAAATRNLLRHAAEDPSDRPIVHIDG